MAAGAGLVTMSGLSNRALTFFPETSRKRRKFMSQPEQLEVLILGSGFGGKLLAWHLAKSGRKTAVVERRWIGGSCPNIDLHLRNYKTSENSAAAGRNVVTLAEDLFGYRKEALWREIVDSLRERADHPPMLPEQPSPLHARAPPGQPPRGCGLVSSRSAPPFLANDLVQLH